eukprot:XP_001709211.1 Hypothetical protein GL50803_119154 [Giardia lamblia ATCC 50803]
MAPSTPTRASSITAAWGRLWRTTHTMRGLSTLCLAKTALVP